MRLLIALLLLPFFCFAQENTLLKVKEIDSIAKSNRAATQASGLIKKKRFLFGKKIIGGFSEVIYMDSPITPDNVKTLNLIKGSYHENQAITNRHTEYINADFYYDSTLFFVRIRKVIDKKGTEPVSLIYEIDTTREIDQSINDQLGFDVMKWIASYDSDFKDRAKSIHGLTICTY